MRSSTALLRRVAAVVAVAVISLSMAKSAFAGPIAITEWMYKGGLAEYLELTNVSAETVDVRNWSQDDNNGNAGVHPFGNAFDTIQAGESVILCDGTNANTFRTYWGLASTVKVYAYGSKDNLGSSDSITVFDSLNQLVDRLDYPNGGPSTSGISANIPLAYVGLNQASHAASSAIGDAYQSYRGNGGAGDLGNPGIYTPYAVPEPSTLALMGVGLSCLLAHAWRKRALT